MPKSRKENEKSFANGQVSGTLPLRAVNGYKEKNLSRKRHQDGQLLELRHGWAVRVYEDQMIDGERQRRRVQVFLGNFEKLPTKRSAQNGSVP